METFLIITDLSGKQYPHLVTAEGIQIEDFFVTEENYMLDEIQMILDSKETIRVKTRIFRTEALVEISIAQHPKGAH
jgi:hypothetical protein